MGICVPTDITFYKILHFNQIADWHFSSRSHRFRLQLLVNMGPGPGISTLNLELFLNCNDCRMVGHLLSGPPMLVSKNSELSQKGRAFATS